jgi:hypothetical protein
MAESRTHGLFLGCVLKLAEMGPASAGTGGARLLVRLLSKR